MSVLALFQFLAADAADADAADDEESFAGADNGGREGDQESTNALEFGYSDV